jgi:hypothetical protein
MAKLGDPVANRTQKVRWAAHGISFALPRAAANGGFQHEVRKDKEGRKGRMCHFRTAMLVWEKIFAISASKTCVTLVAFRGYRMHGSQFHAAIAVRDLETPSPLVGEGA